MEEMDFTGITSENYGDEQWLPYYDRIGWAAFYDPDTGQINWSLRLTLAEIVINHENAGGKPFIGVASEPDPDLQMVSDGALVDRPTLPVVQTGNILSGVPIGADVYVNDEFHIAESSEMALDVPPGDSVRVIIFHWPFRQAEFTYASD